ncbi:hypothetical protein A0H81_06731 [Grifola frondosa]|uniref:Uncharacterized protein n=1 Tax=Grifola frondosa TaxID=5627 RepID=A0A1C7M938_GRIFR|nr:hypothetical protein A0H81_06731 [Grifola frondosa]
MIFLPFLLPSIFAFFATFTSFFPAPLFHSVRLFTLDALVPISGLVSDVFPGFASISPSSFPIQSSATATPVISIVQTSDADTDALSDPLMGATTFTTEVNLRWYRRERIALPWLYSIPRALEITAFLVIVPLLLSLFTAAANSVRLPRSVSIADELDVSPGCPSIITLPASPSASALPELEVHVDILGPTLKDMEVAAFVSQIDKIRDCSNAASAKSELELVYAPEQASQPASEVHKDEYPTSTGTDMTSAHGAERNSPIRTHTLLSSDIEISHTTQGLPSCRTGGRRSVPSRSSSMPVLFTVNSAPASRHRSSSHPPKYKAEDKRPMTFDLGSSQARRSDRGLRMKTNSPTSGGMNIKRISHVVRSSSSAAAERRNVLSRFLSTRSAVGGKLPLVRREPSQLTLTSRKTGVPSRSSSAPSVFSDKSLRTASGKLGTSAGRAPRLRAESAQQPKLQMGNIHQPWHQRRSSGFTLSSRLPVVENS